MLSKISARLRTTLILLWLMVCCAFWLAISLLRWGNSGNNAAAAHLFARLALPLAGVRVRVEGLEHLDPPGPCVYVANHQSSLDVAVFAKVCPRRAVLIGKQELIWIPLFGLGFVAAGNVLIRRKDRRHSFAGLARAVARMRERGVGVFIFPEGTRNRSLEGMLPFKKGAFHMAIEAGAPIIPIVCASQRGVLGPGGVLRGGELTLRVLAPIPVRRPGGDLGPADLERLLDETRVAMSATLAELG
jgi:1-acyl-sn-glycerol-3-phosphate acyltransferase